MNIEFNDILVHYETFGDSGSAIVFLHGWGGSVSSFIALANTLKTKHKCLLIDFPPFGESEEPYTPWRICDYVRLVKTICDKENFENISIIAHSFGGRVAISLASDYNNFVRKLELVSSAGLRPKFSIEREIRKLKYKLAKRRGDKDSDKHGSKDWQKLSGVMKKTFSNIVEEDLKKKAQKISAETLLIFGDKDTETPLYMGKRLRKYIKNSELIVLKGYGHFAYIEDNFRFTKITNSFMRDKL